MKETLIAGNTIGLDAFLSTEQENPLGICIFHQYGASFVDLSDFIEHSKIDMDKMMRHKYACALEILAKQLRESI